MRFVALAVAFVPDLLTARRSGALDGLDDPSVAKILFHRRQQASGRQTLRWDQVATAAITLVVHGPADIEVIDLSSAGTTEQALLDRLDEPLAGCERIVMWDPQGVDLSALRFRTACAGRPLTSLWEAEKVTDLSGVYGGPAVDAPTLDDLAQSLGLPKAVQEPAVDSLDAWLTGDPVPTVATTRRAAINLCALAIRSFHASGTIDRNEMRAGLSRLRQWADARSDGCCPGLSAALAGLE